MMFKGISLGCFLPYSLALASWITAGPVPGSEPCATASKCQGVLIMPPEMVGGETAMEARVAAALHASMQPRGNEPEDEEVFDVLLLQGHLSLAGIPQSFEVHSLPVQEVHTRCGNNFSMWRGANDFANATGEPDLMFNDTSGLFPPHADSVEKLRFEYLAQSSKSRLRKFRDVHVSANGLITIPQKCQVVPIRNPRKWSQIHSISMSDISLAAPEVDVAITLAWKCDNYVYHGPIDVLSSLVQVNTSVLTDPKTYIHLYAVNNYILEWLELIGIAQSRIMTDSIWVKHLYVPEYRENNPSLSQYHWLQSRVWSAIGIPDIASRDLLIVMKRSERGCSNHEEVASIAHDYANAHGLQVHVHDDLDLPPIREQLQIFSRAVMIVGPHGGVEAFLIATAPGACVLEMFYPYWPNDVFQRMIHMLQLHYVGIAMEKNESAKDNVHCGPGWCTDLPNLPVDPRKLRAAMQACGNAAGLHSDDA